MKWLVKIERSRVFPYFGLGLLAGGAGLFHTAAGLAVLGLGLLYFAHMAGEG